MESAPRDFVAEIVLESSLVKPLDYQIPEALQAHVQPGIMVEVPLRGGRCKGFVTKRKNDTLAKKLRPITSTIGTEPVVTKDLFELALWMSKYYHCPLGKVLKTMLPKGVRRNTQLKTQLQIIRKKSYAELRQAHIALQQKAPQQAALLQHLLQAKGTILLSELLEACSASHSSVKSLEEKGLIRMEEVRTDCPGFIDEEYFKTKPKILQEEQQLALQKITSSLENEKFESHLLFGITGSGKTEVYLQAIDKALKLGRGVIMLVPEIALTSQTIQHFKSRFDTPIAALHHRLSDGERFDAWEKVKNGTCRICLGARSAIFCPMPNLGLIIVDEEHEQSYKQSEESPSYSARDVAVMRAKFSNSTVVLGSATPSLESYYNALSGKYTLSIMKSRPASAHLPQVHIVDMKREYEKAKGFTSFSDLLLSKIHDRRAKGEQTILFLNRRGYHTVVSCTSCGKSVHCPHCATTVTFHKKSEHISCHLCGYTSPAPHRCPTCGTDAMIKFSGVGTEKVESMLHGIFPGIQTLRIDADTTRHKGRLEELLQQFRAGKAEVLIGTQMIAKGLHFPQVTLVGVLNCDSALNIPDFRAQESVFQLITQVAGRAGRGVTAGEVILQTGLCEHTTIQHASEQAYVPFYEEEITTRRVFGFPPFCKIVKFQFASKDEEKVKSYATTYAKALMQLLPEEFILHPVMPAGHAKVKDFYRFQFLIRGPSITVASDAIEKVDEALPLPSSLFRFIDVDPTSTFF